MKVVSHTLDINLCQNKEVYLNHTNINYCNSLQKRVQFSIQRIKVYVYLIAKGEHSRKICVQQILLVFNI